MSKGKKKAQELDPTILDAAFSSNNGMAEAVKVALAVLGVGVAAGATLVIGMDQIMKRIFVNDSWPNGEWENNDWAGEELE